MGRNPTKAAGNRYFESRKRAAEHDERLTSREGAGDLLGVSWSSMADYERGLTRVPVDVVIRMSELYKDPALLNWFCCNECPICRDDLLATEMEDIRGMPCTMIEKVAVSQALRSAFPKDYEGMYVAEEVSEQGYTDAEYEQMGTGGGAEDEVIDMTPISQEQRKALFRMVHERMGKETGNELIQAVLAEFKLESTNGMPISIYHKVMDRIMDIMKSCDDQGEAPNQGEDPQE